MEKVKILTDKENIRLNEDIIHSFKKKTSSEVKIKKNKMTLELELLESNPLFYDSISNVIANYIIENIEKGIIKEIVYEECDGLPNDYIEDVLNKIEWELLYKDENNTSRIIDLNKQVLQILEKGKVFSFNGFMRFRFKARFLYLADRIYEMLEEVLTEKGMDDFVTIVKKLIRIQLPKVEFINIISLDNGQYEMITSDDDRISLGELSDSLDEVNSDIEYEISTHELMISALMSLLPKEIFFHVKNDHDLKVFSVVKKIYDGRCHRCMDCEVCEKVRNDKNNEKPEDSQE